jgi:hypothetical protein
VTGAVSGTFALHYLPEPARAFLFAAGAALLGWIERLRRRGSWTAAGSRKRSTASIAERRVGSSIDRHGQGAGARAAAARGAATRPTRVAGLHGRSCVARSCLSGLTNKQNARPEQRAAKRAR